MLRAPLSRKQPTDMSKKSDEIDELSQNYLAAAPKEVLVVTEKKPSEEEMENAERAPTFLMESTASPLEPTRKSSSSEVSLEMNQSNIQRSSIWNAKRTVKQNEQREVFFGSSGGDNNISRSGSAATLIDWNVGSARDLFKFTGGHNAITQTTWKKPTPQVVCIVFFPSV